MLYFIEEQLCMAIKGINNTIFIVTNKKSRNKLKTTQVYLLI